MEENKVIYYQDLAKKLMFELNEEEAIAVAKDFETFDAQLEILSSIDTTDILEMIYPFEEETTFLREDVVDHTLLQTEATKNATKVKQGHFVVPKVVK